MILCFNITYFLFGGDYNIALVEYLRDGMESLNFIKKVLVDNDKDFNKLQNFLDFAAGFGKLERFLIKHMDVNKIWASDIKQSANAFLNKIF